MASIFSVNRKMRSSAENQAGSEGHWRKEKVQIAILKRGRVTEDCSRIAGLLGSVEAVHLFVDLHLKQDLSRQLWMFSPAMFLCPDIDVKEVFHWV